MNNRNALPARLGGVQNGNIDAILQDSAAVRLMNPTKYLDERALASPVLACQRMYPSAMKAEIYVAQNLDWSKALCYPAKFNDRSRQTLIRIGMVQVPRPSDITGLA